MEAKLTLNDVIIEITRRCNLQCEHCLRGNAQNIDINTKFIDALFERVGYIGSLTITGGEPGLRPKLINYIVESAKAHNVDIGSFYLATNGTQASDDFILALIKLYLYCSDNETTQVEISNDQYHDNNEEATRRLQALAFVNYKQGDILDKFVIAEGRAKDFGENYKTDYGFEIDEDYIEGTVYLNALGKIISDCDWSYENQSDHFVCNVNKLALDKLEKYTP